MTTGELDQQGDELENEGLEELGGEQEQGQEIAEAPAWEPPRWSKAWKEPSRAAMMALRSLEGGAAHWDALQKELDQTYSYQGRRDQEYAGYRKRVDPIYNMIAKYEPTYRMQGMSLEQGVGQLFQVAEYLAKDPDAGLQYIAQTNHPRDPAKTIRALAQAWGVDPNTAFEEAPYVDPAISGVLNPLQQQMRQIQEQLNQSQNAQKQAQYNAVVEELRSFESATDESGNPLHPHVRTVWEDMVRLIQTGRCKDLESAYDYACRLNDELAEQMISQHSERLRQDAIEKAKQRTEQARQATAASRNINSGKRGRDGPVRKRNSIKDMVAAAARELGE